MVALGRWQHRPHHIAIWYLCVCNKLEEHSAVCHLLLNLGVRSSMHSNKPSIDFFLRSPLLDALGDRYVSFHLDKLLAVCFSLVGAVFIANLPEVLRPLLDS